MTTIGGVLFRHLDRLPQAGDEVKLEEFWMTVLEVKDQRITRVRVARGDAWGEREAPSEAAAEGQADGEAQQPQAAAEGSAPDNGGEIERQAREG